MFRHFWHDEDGMSTVEYALLLALVAIGALALWTYLGKDPDVMTPNASAFPGD